MRHISLLLIFILSIHISGVTWAASCERCYEKITDDKQLCIECELSTSNRLTDMKSREVQIASVITSARENYKNALEELIQYYMDIGNHLRLERARKELKSLNKVPQREYLSTKEIIIGKSPSKNIEEANILFQDGKEYINLLSITNKKSELKSAETRFKKIVDEYPESDKADDAAYELARIYEGAYFKDYEKAVFYYVKCYSLNASTDEPAHFKAAWIYDKHLMNYKEAVINYRRVLKHSKDETDRYWARTRFMQLRKQGY